MIIGIPKEVKKHENRVSLLPVGVENLVKQGHSVLVEHNAGANSGFTDDCYRESGARIIDNAEEIWAEADLIVKVKEPVAQEYPLMRKGQIIFTYFHFASSEVLTQAVIKAECTAIAYETIQEKDGSLPLLTPMSEVAGRMAVQLGARYLQKECGGRGILVGGVPGVDSATILIIGGGVVGTNAAKMAAGLGAHVYILDINLDRLRYLSDVMPENVITLMSNSHNIRRLVKEADMIINGILIPGDKAPKLISREALKTMKPGSVVIDVAIDQGGGLETSRPTDHENPTYVEEGVLHYCVTNMPGAVPVTSTMALTNATWPYLQQIVSKGFCNAIECPALAKGINILEGIVTHPGVSNAFNLEYTPLEEALANRGLCQC